MSLPRPPNQPPPPAFIPDHLSTEVLSFLPVKSLMRMRCLSKFFNSLFTDPLFIKLHLHRSARKPHLALVTFNTETVVPFPVPQLLSNPPITLTDDTHYLAVDRVFIREEFIIRQVVGSCNGLICLLSSSTACRYLWLRFWNPSTRAMSRELGAMHFFRRRFYRSRPYKFSFGYDNSTNTYKVVSLIFSSRSINTTEAQILSLDDDVWRDIPNFPGYPLQLLNHHHKVNGGVYLSGTINWLSASYYRIVSVDQYMIISLDLGTEIYTQMQLPSGFDEMPRVSPTIGVLMDCLCFSYDFQQTHFVIWRMMEFGVEESWTQFLRVGYENFQIDYNLGLRKFYLVPLYLSENGDTLLLASCLEDRAIFYNIRENSVERTRITNRMCWYSTKDYVESLVSPS
ncbi:F-box/kelch-repeat protein At3g06240-like [Cicer arietinum]|uniref:F-box/kelch-repeat protein At3g06240-like n=1 Tax=Cicer arietinum TaxID=3827 RepID=A0A1S2Z3A9_CICAR|nr:F-box/kelch-repeat protein At3g06240-like [Cicer arietinum]